MLKTRSRNVKLLASAASAVSLSTLNDSVRQLRQAGRVQCLFMGEIQRVRVGWSGGTGGLGVSTFYGEDGAILAADVHAFFDRVRGSIPNEITLQVEPGGDILDDATGTLVGSWTTTTLTPLPGLYAGVYAAPVGLVLNWMTSDIADGHRIKGKTFLVPMGPDQFDGSGNVLPAEVVGKESAGQDMINAHVNNLKVWHRPKASTAAVPAGVAGGSFNASLCIVSRKAAVLRSRRD